MTLEQVVKRLVQQAQQAAAAEQARASEPKPDAWTMWRRVMAERGRPDERLCCSRIRACASELPDERECDDWMNTQSRSGSASMCSSDNYRGEEPVDCC